METLIEKYIEGYFGIDPKMVPETVKLFRKVQMKKDQYFLKKGHFAERMGFVTKGHLRMFSNSLDGNKEVTQWIAGEGMFATDLSSFLFNTTSRWNIQSLDDVTIHVIEKKDYQNLSSVVENWEQLEKIFLSKCFITLENRVFQHLSSTAEERYDAFHDLYPNFFNQVPLHYLASLLGMTPETLSRIRKKKNS